MKGNRTSRINRYQPENVNQMKIIPGPASKRLGENLARLSSASISQVIFRTFPDGESYVRLEGEVKDEEVVIVQTTSPPQDTRLIQLALLADAAKRKGAKSITAVIPYLAYSRQDKIFLPGESLSIETVATMLRAVGIDRLITVNSRETVLSKFQFQAISVSAIPLLAEYFRKKGLSRPFAVAPDKGAAQLAEEARTVLGGESGFLDKHRDRHTGSVSMDSQNLDVRGKTAIIFDDIISSGGTIIEAAQILREQGASEVYAACVHPLLVGDAQKRIIEAGIKEIVGTDSVPSSVSKVSLAPLIHQQLVH